MTQATLTLAGFLLARIDEDEARARAASAIDGAVVMLAALPTLLFDGLRVAFPGRVLAECESKRRIVELHGPDGGVSGCNICDVDIFREPSKQYPCETLQLLALPYADHPGYREEWRL